MVLALTRAGVGANADRRFGVRWRELLVFGRGMAAPERRTGRAVQMTGRPAVASVAALLDQDAVSSATKASMSSKLISPSPLQSPLRQWQLAYAVW